MSDDPKDKTSDEGAAEDSPGEEAPAIDRTMVGGSVPPPVDPTARAPESPAADLGQTMAGGAPPPVIPAAPPTDGPPADEPAAPLDQTMMGPAAPPPIPPATPPDEGTSGGASAEPPADLGQTMAGAGAAPPSIQPAGAGSGHVDAGAALDGVDLSADLEMTIAGPPPGGSLPVDATVPAPPKAQPSVRLERVLPAERAGSVPLDPGKDSFVLGRSRESDLPLFTLSASRQHARLLRTADGWALEPVGDRRVSIDDRFIQETTPLRHGCRIRLGEDEFVFDDGSAPLPGPTMGGRRGATASASPGRSAEPTEQVPRRSGRLVLWIVLAFVALALVLAGVLMSRVIGGREPAPAASAEEAMPVASEEPAPVAAPPEPEPEPERGPELLPIEADAPPPAEAPEPEAEPPPAVPGVDVEALLTRADELRRQYKLTTPPGENAYDLYREVLAAEPGNAGAQAGVAAIRDTYLAFARREIGKRDPAQAAVYLERAEAVGAGAETRAVREQLEELRGEMELGKQVPASEPERTESVAALAADDPPPPPPAEEEEESGFLFGIFD